MNTPSEQPPARIAIACGGTGGHLFPGIAVAQQFLKRGCSVSLMISEKEVDQLGIRSAPQVPCCTLPAVGLVRGGKWRFLRAFWRSYRASQKWFANQPPSALLAMGGFTSAPPAVAARRLGARVTLHESNVIPGRANRWLSHIADEVFVGFSDAGKWFRKSTVTPTGTPVRTQFKPGDPALCRRVLGLNPDMPVLLVMGGSQGAHAVNRLALEAIRPLADRVPRLQVLHIAGKQDAGMLREGYRAAHVEAIVFEFLSEMELALGAATAAVARGGASSLAEVAAVRVPTLVIPYPTAVDNHQLLNAQALQKSGACLVLEENSATPEKVASELAPLFTDPHKHAGFREALGAWYFPAAAETIAERILSAIPRQTGELRKKVVAVGSGRHSSAIA